MVDKKPIEDRVHDIMKDGFTPAKAAKLGFVLMFFGAPVWAFAPYPYLVIGVVSFVLGTVSLVIGVLDWLGLIDREQLKKDLRKAAKDIWNGT